jgi:hypothetical protein
VVLCREDADVDTRAWSVGMRELSVDTRELSVDMRELTLIRGNKS